MNIERIKKWLDNHPRVNFIQYSIRTILPFREKCTRILNDEKNPLTVRFASYGDENPDKLIYQVNLGRDFSSVGFCSLLRFTLLFLKYAEEFKLLPVINWGKELLYYDSAKGENVFLYYFEQVSCISYEQSNESKYVACSKFWDTELVLDNRQYRAADNEINMLASMYAKYIKFNESGNRLINNEVASLLSGKKVLGVHVRGTDFRENYDHHPIPITGEYYVEQIENSRLLDYYAYIFLATDEQVVIDLFTEKFGDKVLYFHDTYRSNDGKPIHYGLENVNKSKLAEDILKDVYALGRCDGLMCGLSNVSIIARCIKCSFGERYDDEIIIDKGLNHNLKDGRLISLRMSKR